MECSATMLENITPLFITYNEEQNIGRALEKVTWAREIVVVDSGSTDATLEIVRAHSQAKLVQRDFDSFADQCNFGLTQIKTDWVLSLDADYIVTDELLSEIRETSPGSDVSG